MDTDKGETPVGHPLIESMAIRLSLVKIFLIYVFQKLAQRWDSCATMAIHGILNSNVGWGRRLDVPPAHHNVD